MYVILDYVGLKGLNNVFTYDAPFGRGWTFLQMHVSGVIDARRDAADSLVVLSAFVTSDTVCQPWNTTRYIYIDQYVIKQMEIKINDAIKSLMKNSGRESSRPWKINHHFVVEIWRMYQRIITM